MLFFDKGELIIFYHNRNTLSKPHSITDCDTTMTPPPAGGGSKTGAQESPSMSDVEIEYDIVLPDKGKGKAVPDNTAQGGSGHCCDNC